MGQIEEVFWCKKHEAINDGCNDSQSIGFVEYNE